MKFRQTIRDMTRTNRKSTYSVIALVIALAISPAVVTGQNGDEPERSLEGVWLATIVPRNCTTGDPIPNAAFETIWTFHKDGTMLVSIRNGSITLERTAAHGLWRSTRGWSDYAFKFVHIRRTVSTGAFFGKQEGGGTLVLSESGDEFTSDGWSVAYTVGGVPVNPTPGCSNAAGTRFKLEL